jgi:HEAT repeat protein
VEQSQAAGGGTPAAKPRRMLWLWIGSFVFLGLIAAFCWLVLKPYVEVRASFSRLSRGASSMEAEIEYLGGPRAAARKLLFYSRLPACFAPTDQRAAVIRMGACGSEAVPLLVPLLRSEDPTTRNIAASALGTTGDRRCVPALIAALDDPAAKCAAIDSLAKLGDDRAVPQLIALLKGPDGELRLRACYALGELRDRRAIEPLISALGDQEPTVRVEAARSLGLLGDHCAVEPLVKALRDADGKVRFCAAVGLGQLKDRRALEPLMTALADRDHGVHLHAARALGELGDERAIPALKALAETEQYSHIAKAAREAVDKISAARKRGEEAPK